MFMIAMALSAVWLVLGGVVALVLSGTVRMRDHREASERCCPCCPRPDAASPAPAATAVDRCGAVRVSGVHPVKGGPPGADQRGGPQEDAMTPQPSDRPNADAPARASSVDPAIRSGARSPGRAHPRTGVRS